MALIDHAALHIYIEHLALSTLQETLAACSTERWSVDMFPFPFSGLDGLKKCKTELGKPPDGVAGQMRASGVKLLHVRTALLTRPEFPVL